MKSIFFLLILTQYFVVYAQKPEPRSLKALSTSVSGSVFQGTLEPGYHFNYKAPNRIRSQGENFFPVLKNPRRIDFRLQSKDHSSSYAELYVCDDAVTYCETLPIALASEKKARLVDPSQFSKGPKPSQGASSDSGESEKSADVNKNEFGFLEGDLEKILDQARSQKKLVLFDFSAIWCPGCLRLEQEIFPTKEFKSWAKDLFLVKIDTDKFENQAFARKYNLRGVPTLLLATPEGEEIQRIYDYQPLSLLKKFFESGQKNPQPLKELEKLVKEKSKGDEDSLNLLAERFYFAGQFEDSVRVWSQVKKPSPFLWDAKIEVAKKSEKKEELLKVLEEALQIESTSFRSVSWRVDLIKENHSQSQKLYEEGLKLIQDFWKSPRVFEEALQTTLVGDMTGFEKLLLAYVEGDLRSTYLKQVQKKEADSKEMADAWKESIAKSSSLFQKNQPLGPSIRYLNGLILGQQLGEAETLLSSLIQRFPKETDLLRRQLRVLVLQKKFAEAVRVGETALKSSYGRNEFWTIEFLAQAYKGHGKINEAKQLLDRALSRSELNQDNMKKTKEGLQKIRSSLD